SGSGLACAATASAQSTLLDTVNWRPNPDPAKDCRSQFALALTRVSSGQYPPDPRDGNAAHKTTWPELFASTALSWSRAAGASVSLVVPMGLALVAFVLLFV